jgi:hypothetical protein
MQMNAALKDTAFARADAPINRDNLYYLGITDGLHDYLVVAWSHVDGNNNRWLTAVHALHRLVGPDNLPLFRIAFDPGILSDFSFLELCSYLPSPLICSIRFSSA